MKKPSYRYVYPILFLLVLPVLFFRPLRVSAAEKPGWIIKNGKYYWQKKSGVILKKKGWLHKNHKTYFLAADGSRVQGFVIVKKKYYYLNEKTGVRYEKTGWKSLSGDRYYFRKDHSAATGLVTIQGNHYIFGGNGVLITNYPSLFYKGKNYRISKSGIATLIVAPRNPSRRTEPTAETEADEEEGGGYQDTPIRARCRELTWQFINRYSSASQSPTERLRSCFNHLEAYQQFVVRGSDFYDFSDGFQYRFAVAALESSLSAPPGDCYCFASILASVASELGFSPTIHLAREDHAFVTIDGRYYDNSGAQFAAAVHNREYSVWKSVSF